VSYYTYSSASLEGRNVAEDISRGGMRLPVSRVVRKGDVLKMDIYPSKKDYPISARGKVRWVQKLKDTTPFDIDAGIEFISIDPDDIDKLLHFI
jgi:c-di-GMP-binding flagellar brake protein YcgR